MTDPDEQPIQITITVEEKPGLCARFFDSCLSCIGWAVVALIVLLVLGLIVTLVSRVFGC